MKVRHKYSLAWAGSPKRGMIVATVAMSIVVATFFSAVQLFKSTALEYRLTQNKGEKKQSHYCAKTGFELGMALIVQHSEKNIYSFGIGAQLEMGIPFSVENCTVLFQVQREDGKVNVNHLVNDFDSSMNSSTRGVMNDLFEQLDIDYRLIDWIVDYIDTDNSAQPNGGEIDDYQAMNPPRRIKNDYLFSSQELLAIPGITYSLLKESRKPVDWDEQNSDDFATEVEAAMRQDSDWILENSITAFPRFDTEKSIKININSANYFVLRSINIEVMDHAAIQRIFKLRLDNDGFIDKIDKLKDQPEFILKTGDDLTRYDAIKDFITTKGRYFRIKAVGEYKDKLTVSTVEAILDKKQKKLLWFKEY